MITTKRTEVGEDAADADDHARIQQLENAWALHGEYDDDFWKRFAQHGRDYDEPDTGIESPISIREQEADSFDRLSRSQIFNFVTSPSQQ